MLIAVSELAAHWQQPDWVVVDCRFDLARPDAGEAAYRAGHIPGAFYAHLETDLAAPRTPASGRHPLPDPANLLRLFSRWGVGPGVRVVAYDDAGGAMAARLWWLLRWMGHAEAALLDGGFQAWQAAGLPLSVTTPAPRAAPVQGTPGHMPVIDAAQIERRLRAGDLLLIDARARARFLGQVEPIDPVAGHVPGAINHPYQDNLAGDGRFKDTPELRRAFQVTLAAGGDVAAMCGSGITACHHIFAMELAGLGLASLYPGSWSEWIRSPSRPVSRQPEQPRAGD